eukprot:gene20638-22673_t
MPSLKATLRRYKKHGTRLFAILTQFLSGLKPQRGSLTEMLDQLGVEERRNNSDEECKFKIGQDFKRFSQKNEVFCRSWWDKTVKSKKSEQFYVSYRLPLTSEWKGRGSGFSQRDFALRNASWHITDIFAEMKENEDRREGFLDTLTALRDGTSSPIEFESEQHASSNIKHVAKRFGADMVGITNYDQRWTYSKKFSCATGIEKTNELDDDMNYVIVLAHSMDKDLLQTVPSALSGAATGLGYAKDNVVLLSISQYLLNLGYKAVPSMNDTALSIPYAIQAGLGEYGRHGLLITPKYGPRVRIGKIFTNLPMACDKPIKFGVEKFCNICDLCVKACPAKAIFDGLPQATRVTASTMPNVEKWSINPEKCFKYWTTINTDCSVCIRVCPYNRGGMWYDAVWRYLAGTFLRKPMLYFDSKSKRGKKLRPKDWWPEIF